MSVRKTLLAALEAIEDEQELASEEPSAYDREQLGQIEELLQFAWAIKAGHSKFRQGTRRLVVRRVCLGQLVQIR